MTQTTLTTRQRILDIALDLFTEKGYENTSLRDIAEALGFTKAAIYYHFKSKEDIFMALHLQLHEKLIDTLSVFDPSAPFDLEAITLALESSADGLLANRRLLALHERNRAAFETIHTEDHRKEHVDLEGRLQAFAADPSVPLRDRVRVASAVGALMGAVMMVLVPSEGDDGEAEAVAAELRATIRDILRPATAAPRPAPAAAKAAPARPRARRATARARSS